MCIDFLLHALCLQSLKFRPFVDPEKLYLQKSQPPSQPARGVCKTEILFGFGYKKSKQNLNRSQI